MKEIDKDAVQYMELAYNIPEVNLQDLNRYYNFEKYLSKGIKVLGFEVKRIHAVNDICEIDENAELLITELHSDDEYDLLFHIDILSLVKDYSELVPQPKLEEFVLLFIKSYYDEVKGYYTFRFSDSFSS